jgi:glycosyltransferase involved in cell wall biosynthesis
MAHDHPLVTVVVPAHNEELGLSRLLPLLLGGAAPGEFTVLVVCNGCSDGSAAEARKHGADVEVVELAEASKSAALAAGSARIRTFPVAFVDADVALDTASMRALVAEVGRAGILAAGPARRLEREGVARLAGWYYDIWERLPQVRSGLFGRGVIVLSETGFRRVSRLPPFISDDLAYSESFRPDERSIVSSAVVSVRPARTWRALLKRRIRVVQGNRELGREGGASPAASTSVGDLLRIARTEPRMAARLPLFLAMTFAARIAERLMRTDRTVWLRDETSRTS